MRDGKPRTAAGVTAGQCGFGDIDTFRRAFQRRTGVTPAAYRRAHADMAA